MSKETRENGPVEALRPERWCAQQEAEVVMHLLRGEELGAVSRETQVPAHELELWRRVFLDGGTQGLKRRTGDPGERELTRTRAKLGETTTKRELVEGLLVRRGIMERWMRTLKEECPYLHDFGRLEEARAIMGAFLQRYNEPRILERHGYRTRPRCDGRSRNRRHD